MIRRLHRFAALPRSRRHLLLRSLAGLTAARVRLLLFPTRAWKAAFPVRQCRRHAHSAEEIAWAVTTASAYVPRATCLVQAVAARSLLARAGYPSNLRIGVAPAAPSAAVGLDAHAWLEWDGEILLGGTGVRTYRPLLTL